jgi:hypothetical protein
LHGSKAALNQIIGQVRAASKIVRDTTEKRHTLISCDLGCFCGLFSRSCLESDEPQFVPLD